MDRSAEPWVATMKRTDLPRCARLRSRADVGKRLASQVLDIDVVASKRGHKPLPL
jgi:hypothetical protein